MEILQEAVHRHPSEETPFKLTALELIREFQEEKKRIPGLGHRIHTSDPRTQRLFELARELGIARYGVAMLEAIQEALAEETKDLPINVDGAIAAILVDLEIPSAMANAFFILARVPGLVAHIVEEQQRERPMRRIHPTAHGYDGPVARNLPQS
jgi:citrate synthase